MNMRFPSQTKPSYTPTQTGLLQRRCSECSKKEKLLQRQAVNQPDVSEVPAIVHDVLRSPGQSIDAMTRTLMESRLGHDFSQVRVHTDAKAAASAEAVDSLAYTVKQDIVFGAGQYTPGSIKGQKLLAHELTHVVQQGQSDVPAQLKISAPTDGAEYEAEHVAQTVVNEPTMHSIESQVSPQVQRSPYGEDDPIHRPLIDQYRRDHGLPLSGVDEFGESVGPSDAEIKYGQRTRVFQVTVPPPSPQTLTDAQARAMAQQTSGTVITQTPNAAPTPSSSATPTAPPARTSVFQSLAREPVKFGFDFTSDSNIGQTITLLPRHLDAVRFQFLGVPVDVLHEPGVNVGVSLSPLTLGVVSAGVGGALLNIHFQDHGWDFIELALGQSGCAIDTTGAFSCAGGAQAEIHSRNNHFSITLGGGGTVTRMPNGTWNTAFTPLTFGILVHILNP